MNSLILVSQPIMGGGVTTNVIVTIDGSSTNYSYNNSPITIKIKDKTIYTISFSDIEGYFAPESITYTAEAGMNRNLNYTYKEINNGVFIMDLNGNLNAVSSWTGGANATGVVLITDQCEFIIAPTTWISNEYNQNPWNENMKSSWGGAGIELEYIPVGYENGIIDFNGSTNTDIIISALKDTVYVSEFEDDLKYTGAPAAEYCRAYSNGCKGAGQWYLPAAGEYNQIILNKAAVEEALTAINGELLSIDWTSTQADGDSIGEAAMVYDCDINEWSWNYKHDTDPVRPICKLKNQTGQIATFNINYCSRTFIFEVGMTMNDWLNSKYNEYFTSYNDNEYLGDIGYMSHYISHVLGGYIEYDGIQTENFNTGWNWLDFEIVPGMKIYAFVESNLNDIQFTIDGVARSSRFGMLWKEYVDHYNNENSSSPVYGEGVYIKLNSKYLYKDDKKVINNEIIEPDGVYITK